MCVLSMTIYQQIASRERSHITSNKKQVQSQQGVEKLLATG